VAINTILEIEGHPEIIVAKRSVLLRIKNFKHWCGGITLNPASQLVELVQHHDAIARAVFFDRLNDVGSRSARARAPMASDSIQSMGSFVDMLFLLPAIFEICPKSLSINIG